MLAGSFGHITALVVIYDQLLVGLRKVLCRVRVDILMVCGCLEYVFWLLCCVLCT